MILYIVMHPRVLWPHTTRRGPGRGASWVRMVPCTTKGGSAMSRAIAPCMTCRRLRHLSRQAAARPGATKRWWHCRAAPELNLTFRVSVIAEGAKPAPDGIAALNDLPARASRKLRLE